ncbi:hypothetical protein [Candidatus Bartonella washoeensis]|uniref:hypothetical protein n=1 Tax=Candidatus Bartonella washoeensis TaxID=186739 RepID=UPI0002DF921A|nr:hypothetical protein [Bartonella washoeensis]
MTKRGGLNGAIGYSTTNDEITIIIATVFASRNKGYLSILKTILLMILIGF